MKRIMKSGVLAALPALLVSANMMAQTTDTVRVKETTVVRDTVVQQAPAEEEPLLRRGEFYVRYMPTFSSLSVRSRSGDVIEGQIGMSHGVGVGLGFNFTRHLGVVGEISYNEINQKFKDQNLNRVVHISYLNIPVMLSLNTDKTKPVNLNFVAGPQFALNIGSSIKGDTSPAGTETVTAVVAAKAGDVGMAYGAGLEFALNPEHTFRLDLGFRGYYGLVDMRASQTSNNPDTYNILVRASRKTYAAYLGVAFLF